MRILFMADVGPDPNRGAAGTEVQSIRALRRLGHVVDEVWAPALGRRIKHGNLHLLLELPRTYERAAMREMRRQRYDVVHVNQPHGFRAARAVHRLSPASAFIHRSHGLELNVEQTLAPRRARPKLASRAIAALLARHSYAIAREADGHVVSSTIDARFLEESLHVPPEKIAAIPQAAPDDYLRTPAPPMTRERLLRVLYVGQVTFAKAPAVTAASINLMAAQKDDLCFTWVCDRADHDQVRGMLTPEANTRTELLHWTTQDQLRAIYDAHGVFIFPSFFEGFGKAFLEAMSRGLCVVASDAGGMHDVIVHGRNGFLVTPGSAEQTAAVAIALRYEQGQEISQAAASTAAAYTWDRVARELTAFYEARIAARKS